MKSLKLAFLYINLLIASTVIAQEDPFLSIIVDAGESITTNINTKTTFEVKAFSVDGSQIIKYEWDFNNDSKIDVTATEKTVSYSYSNTGEYLAKVIVTNNQGKSSFDAVKVIVSSGSTYLKSSSRQPLTTSDLKTTKAANGVVNNYAVMINGGSEQRFWNDVDEMYTTLKTIYGFTDSEILLLNDNGSDPSGNNPNNMIDFAATIDNVNTVFSNLANTIDEDDILFVWIDDHGSGYCGSSYYKPSNYGVFYTRASVESGDEQDYIESNFKLRALYTGGTYAARHGMNVWKVWREYDSNQKMYKYFRNKYVSTYNITLQNGTSSSDNDIYIERFVDYLLGDTNKDGFIDTGAGETYDYDGDGVQPYNSSTGAFDEDDWGSIDDITDNYNTLYTYVPGSNPWSYILFDKNFDNCLDVDIRPICSIGSCSTSQLVADGTDINNDGLFDGVDANQDGDKTDWVSIDESVSLSGSKLYDDELKAMLNNISAKNITVFLEPCFSGGFIDDLSKKGRVIMSATIEENVSWGNYFVGYFREAVHNKTSADVNNDGEVSMLEAFNYASQKDPASEIPQYDDNGDQISNQDPIPSGGDGCLGATLSINSILLDDLSLTNMTISSNQTYQAKNITIDNVTIQNNSSVIFNVANELEIVKDFEVKLGSTFEINNSQCP